LPFLEGLGRFALGALHGAGADAQFAGDLEHPDASGQTRLDCFLGDGGNLRPADVFAALAVRADANLASRLFGRN
jgi:hypothetical protein